VTYIASAPLVPVRASADDRAEQVTQFLFGECVEVLEQGQGDWVLARSQHDHYQGWLDRRMLEEIEHWCEKDLHTSEGGVQMLTNPLTRININGRGALWLPAGAIVPSSLNELSKQVVCGDDLRDVADLAKSFLGAPYLWGGRSVLGVDCSGLVQLCALLTGHALPRDASEQAQHGQAVDFSALQNGDAVFFHKANSTAISHVGWAFHEQSKLKVIHASGEVRIDALTENGIVRDGLLTHEFNCAKRYSNNLSRLQLRSE